MEVNGEKGFLVRSKKFTNNITHDSGISSHTIYDTKSKKTTTKNKRESQTVSKISSFSDKYSFKMPICSAKGCSNHTDHNKRRDPSRKISFHKYVHF